MQVEILDPQGRVSYRRPHDHPDVMEALSTPGYSVRGAEPKGEPQVRSSAGLAADSNLSIYKARMDWLHDCSSGCTDPDGYEWGIYRVKWENGKAVEVWQTNSDFSDLDAEMAREKAANVRMSDGK